MGQNTNLKEWEIVYSDRTTGNVGDFPVALRRKSVSDEPSPQNDLVVDPVFDWNLKNNLYGRIMTLVEATTEPSRLKAVKDVFSKEIESWSADVYRSAREKAEGFDSSTNLYN